MTETQPTLAQFFDSGSVDRRIAPRNVTCTHFIDEHEDYML
jgi:hypothetical protein